MNVWARCFGVCPLQNPPGKSLSLKRACPSCQQSRALVSFGGLRHSGASSRSSSTRLHSPGHSLGTDEAQAQASSQGPLTPLGRASDTSPGRLHTRLAFTSNPRVNSVTQKYMGAPWGDRVMPKVVRIRDGCQLQTAQARMRLSGHGAEQ